MVNTHIHTHREPGGMNAAGSTSIQTASLSPQRSWAEACMSTRTSSCVTQTPSTGRTSSRTRGSILWWCPPTAASRVSNKTSKRSQERSYESAALFARKVVLHTHSHLDAGPCNTPWIVLISTQCWSTVLQSPSGAAMMMRSVKVLDFNPPVIWWNISVVALNLSQTFDNAFAVLDKPRKVLDFRLSVQFVFQLHKL